MRVLVACECSGRVRDAFIRRGHYAMSCDLQESENGGNHYQGDVFDIISKDWDLMVAHPPCTFICRTSQQWLNKQPGRWKLMEEGCKFFNDLLNAPIKKIAVENPRPNIHAVKLLSRTFDQIIQPYYWGDPATKETCIWRKNLPALTWVPKGSLFGEPTEVEPEYVFSKRTGRKWGKWFWESSMLRGEERSKFRSRTFPGIANAFGEQWG